MIKPEGVQTDVIAVRSAGGELSFGDLEADRFGLRLLAGVGSTVGLATTDATLVAAALWALDGWASEVHLIGATVDRERLPDGAVVIDAPAPAGAERLGGVVDDTMLDTTLDTALDTAAETTWVVYTSGTTGVPKSVRHTITSLSRTVVRSEGASKLVWGLLYDPNRMAGIQVLLQALLSGTTVVAADLHAGLSVRLKQLAEAGVTALSATPTLWRLILSLGGGELDLRQITLGGEIADQTVLNALATRFPEARVVHVFASTETGAAFSVSDGREGFPVSYLSDPPRGITLAVRDGILAVYSPGVSSAEEDGFASTGDVVEIVDDRVVFRGRASGVVSVGGANVWPEEIEGILRTHPEVAEAVVSVKPNPMSGNLLIATVVPAPDVDPAGLGKRVRVWIKSQVPNTHVPAMVKVAESIEVSSAGKAVR